MRNSVAGGDGFHSYRQQSGIIGSSCDVRGRVGGSGEGPQIYCGGLRNSVAGGGGVQKNGHKPLRAGDSAVEWPSVQRNRQ